MTNRLRNVEKEIINAWINWKDCRICKRQELNLMESEANRNSKTEKLAWLSGGVVGIIGTFMTITAMFGSFLKPDSDLIWAFAGTTLKITGLGSALVSSLKYRSRENKILDEAKKCVQKEEDNLEDMISKSDTFENIRETLRNFMNERRPQLYDILKSRFQCEIMDVVILGASGVTIHTALAIVFGISITTERTTNIRDIISGNKVICIAMYTILCDLYQIFKMSRLLYHDDKSVAAKAVHELVDNLSSPKTESVIQYVDELMYSISKDRKA